MSHGIAAHATRGGAAPAGGHALAHHGGGYGGTNNDWVRLDLRAISALWIAYRTDPIAQGCRNAIISRLLSGGILYTKSDFSSLPDDEFNSHINTEFVNFSKSVIDSIYVTGFAAYVVDPEAGVPRVIPFTRADVRVRVDPMTFETQLGFFRDGEDEPATDVFFIVDAAPDEYGSLQSAMVCYYPHRVFKDMIMRTTAEAESVRARPPIYTTTETDRAFEERRLAHIGEVDGLRASITRDNHLVRNRIITDVHAQQERLTEMLNAARVDTSDPSYRTDPITGLRGYDADLAQKYSPIIPLPADAKIAAAPMPTARGDFVALNQYLNNMCSVAFGVNLEAVGGNITNKSSDTVSQANNVTTSTVNRFKSLLTNALIHIYKLIWLSDDAGDGDVTVLFPSIVSTQTMLILFDRNIVTYRALCAYLHKHLGVPMDMFEKKDARPAMQPQPAAPAGGAFGGGAGGGGAGGGAGGGIKSQQAIPPDLLKMLP